MDWNERLRAEIEQLEELFLSEGKLANESFRIESGAIPVFVSAPHSVSQWRLGNIKAGEYRTGSITRFLHRTVGCHCAYKTKNEMDDANFDDHSAYRDAVVSHIQQHGIQYFIDLHIMSPLRSHSIDLGTGNGKNIRNDQTLVHKIKEIFERNRIPDVRIDDTFTADNPHTVSSTVARETGIDAVQIEMNWRLLDFDNPEQLVGPITQSLQEIILEFSERVKP